PYTSRLATRPDPFDSCHLLGVVYYQRGKHAEAVRQFDIALRRDRNNIHALNNRGNILKELNRYEEALASLDRAIAARPDYAEAHSNRASVLHALRRYDEAL